MTTGHALAFEVNCSILFTELPLLERPAAARAAGFDGVEFWWPFATAIPADGEVEAFARAVGDAGVRAGGAGHRHARPGPPPRPAGRRRLPRLGRAGVQPERSQRRQLWLAAPRAPAGRSPMTTVGFIGLGNDGVVSAASGR